MTATKKENYYRLTIENFGEYYEYGQTAEGAIETTRLDFANTALGLGVTPRPLGGIRIRRAVYGEWKRELTQDGQPTL